MAALASTGTMTSRIDRTGVPKLSGATWRRLSYVSTALAAMFCAGAATAPVRGQALVTASGDVNPGGPSSPHWTVPFIGQLFVGYSNTSVTGTLTVSGGGSVSGNTGYLGFGTDTTGVVNVSGTDGSGNVSAWTNRDSLYVGFFGNGTLTVAAGGKVSAPMVELATLGAGTLNLNGDAASGRGVLEAGYVTKGLGAATLNLDGGILRAAGDASDFLRGFGMVAAGVEGIWIDSNGHDIAIGPSTAFAGSSSFHKIGSGVLTLTGDSSGFAGTARIDGGALNLAQGGRLGSSAGTIGTDLNDTGAMTVSGADGGGNASVWINTGALRVGVEGSGTLTVADGGMVSASTVELASDATGVGVLNLKGNAGSGRGVLETGSVTKGAGAATLDLDGGILRAANDASDFLRGFGALTAGVEGIWIDSNGHDIAVGPGTAFAGSSSLHKIGSGALTLAGDSSGFTGTTMVSTGALLVGGAAGDGKLGGAVHIGGAATLGGTGVLTGPVSIDGTLSAGNSPGTLTFADTLTLNAGSKSVFELNSPGVVGGASNDLVVVNGDLALGGTLDARVAAAGYYRLFSYGGALTGAFSGGVVTGTGGFTSIMPNNPDVQYGIPGQVNLSVLASGQTMQFWDGPDHVGNGVVDGGAGAWSASGANWTGRPGEAGINGTWAGSVGVFAGQAGGVVAVAGVQNVDTLQFSTSGYELRGGTLAIGVAGGGVLTVDSGVTTAIASTIADGAGSALRKAGGGTLVLSGANSYTGGTVLSGGVLSVASDTSLGAASGALRFDGGMLKTAASFETTRAITLTQAGRFDVAAGTELGLRGMVSGPGDLVKSGDGALRLSGANSYAGDTVVSAGTLLGDAGAIRGNIANAGTVIFDQAGDANFAGEIVGLGGVGGAMVKRGAGRLSLDGTSMLNWSIEAGALASAAERLRGDATIGPGAALIFEQTSNGTYAGVIAGSGGFGLAGAGVVTLTGNSSGFAGMTTIGRGSALIVGTEAGGALGGSMRVEAGGLIGGTGAIGAAGATVAAGAVHAPGNSIGVQTVAGDYANHGTLRIEATPTHADKVVAAGAVDITGATLDLVLTPTDAAKWNVFNGPHTIIDKQSAGAVVGSFATVTKNLLFLDAVLAYDGGDGNDVTLSLNRNDLAFAGVGRTRNQIAVGAAVDRLGNASPIWRAIALTNDPDIVRASFNALSGEIHASTRTVLIEDSRFLRNAVNDRIRSAFGAVAASRDPVVTYGDGRPRASAATADRPAIWSSGFGSWGRTDSDGNAARLDRATSGVFIGADAPVLDTIGSGDWRLGAIAGYSRTSFDTTDVRSSGVSDNYHAGLYGGATWGVSGGSLAFRSGVAYTRHDIDTRRAVIPGLGDKLRGANKAGTAQAFGELGYGMRKDRLAFEPFANLAYVSLRSDGFTEQGGAAALAGPSATTDARFTTLGLRAAAIFAMNGNSLTTTAMLGWRHAFGAVSPDALMRFAAGGDPFVVAGAPIARDAAIIEAGLRYGLTQAAALGVAYGGQFGSGAFDQSFRANFNLKF